jgi:hypothetical protein
MTFNIRYDNPDDNLNNWKYRKEEVVNWFVLKKLTFLVQEVLVNQLKDMSKKLPEYRLLELVEKTE